MQGEAYREFSDMVEENREALRKMVLELHGQAEFMTGKCPLQHCGITGCFRRTEENSLTVADMK